MAIRRVPEAEASLPPGADQILQGLLEDDGARAEIFEALQRRRGER